MPAQSERPAQAKPEAQLLALLQPASTLVEELHDLVRMLVDEPAGILTRRALE